MIDKVCKYKMDTACIVEETMQTQFYPQRDGQTNWQEDKVKQVYPHSTLLKQDIKMINSLRLSDEYKLTIIISDNGLSPGWHQDIIWTNAGDC